MNKKGFASIIIILVVMAIAALGGGAWYYQKTNVTTPNKQVEPTPRPPTVDSDNSQNALTFITPVESETLVRGNSHVIVWDGIYSKQLILKIVSTPIGSNVSTVIANTVPSSNKRNQIVWDIPCNFDYSQGWYKLVLIDKNTNTVIANSPNFIISKQQATICSPNVNTTPSSRSKIYSDTTFGFSFSYPENDTISTDSSGKIIIDSPRAGKNSIVVGTFTIKKMTDKAVDSNGKFGSVTIFFDSTINQWVETGTNERNSSTTTTLPVQSVFMTTSGLPVFRGAIPNHGWGAYSYIVALSHTKFLVIEGTDSDAFVALVKSVSPLAS